MAHLPLGRVSEAGGDAGLLQLDRRQKRVIRSQLPPPVRRASVQTAGLLALRLRSAKLAPAKASASPSVVVSAEREGGFALLIVLWTIVLLAVLVTYLTAAGRGETQLAGNLRTASVLEAAADGAVAEAIFHLLDTSNRHWPADGAVHRLHQPGAMVDLRIDSEAGKINLNTVQPALLQALLHVIGVDTRTAASIAAAVSDWRFPDVQPVAGGAKMPQYRNAGRPYGPLGEPFQTVDELGLVLGVTPEILLRITPYLTIYHEGEPDMRYASVQVLRAMRESAGADPAPGLGPPDERVVRITATAARPDDVDTSGAQVARGSGLFVRRALVRIGSHKRGGLFEILTWDTDQG